MESASMGDFVGPRAANCFLAENVCEGKHLAAFPAWRDRDKKGTPAEIFLVHKCLKGTETLPWGKIGNPSKFLIVLGSSGDFFMS